MRRNLKQALRWFLVEFGLYAALVGAYYFLVLHYLGHWLNGLFIPLPLIGAAIMLHGLLTGHGTK
jgi:hypothetical protein